MYVEERLAEIAERRIAHGRGALSPDERNADLVAQAVFLAIAGGPDGLRDNGLKDQQAFVEAARAAGIPEFSAWLIDVFALTDDERAEDSERLYVRFLTLEQMVYDRLEAYLFVQTPTARDR